MILSIGEILADMIGKTVSPQKGETETTFSRYPGGAPFNVACNLANLGAKVGFCGRVGDDLVGSFLCDFAETCGFDRLALQTDPNRNTTLAFVELDADGERSFCFYRKGTADYFIDTTEIEPLIADADIVHLGSLMLSAPEGRAVADRIIALVRQHGKKLSFDINYRDDIFENAEQAVAIYWRYAAQADIVKYSEEEATLFTETSTVDEAVEVLKGSDALSFVTLGKRGSLCVWRGEVYRMDTISVECVDTTGSGDAFFAGALSVLDHAADYTPEVLKQALRIGNICGAITATGYGAIHKGLNTEAVRRYIVDPKYRIDTPVNRAFMRDMVTELLQFAVRFPSPEGCAYYLDDTGAPCLDKTLDNYETCRMVHSYAIGKRLGFPGSDELIDAGLKGLFGAMRDPVNGGWYNNLNPDHSPIPGKLCYSHAFVILAASSAIAAGHEEARPLLSDALACFDAHFWDDEVGLSRDTYNNDFTVLDTYRGVNANMHSVEAFLAVADVTGDEIYRVRAGRIIDHVVGWAEANDWRIPEHFTEDWQPDLECNADHPDDRFKPYGATPGHGIEWARLITQWALSTYPDEPTKYGRYIAAAENLFLRAVRDGWNADGAPGIVYTTD